MHTTDTLRKITEGTWLHDATGVRIVRGGDGLLRTMIPNQFGGLTPISTGGVVMKVQRKIAAGAIDRIRGL